MALLVGFCQAVQTELMTGVETQFKAFLHCIDATWQHMQKNLQHNEHAQYQLSDTLLKLQVQGLVIMQNPYRARVQAVSPGGYLVELEIVKTDAETLMNSVTGLLGWLESNKYTMNEVPLA